MQRLEQLWKDVWLIKIKFGDRGSQLSDHEAMNLERRLEPYYCDFKAMVQLKPEDDPLPEPPSSDEMPVRHRIQWYLDEIKKMREKILASHE